MNRTGDLYMNRIALAVKSALSFALLVPPSLTLAAAAVDTSPLDAPAASAADTGPLEEIVVTGIRYSLKESLATKRASTNVVEVVTAEDIGKLPDKNVADVLQRVVIGRCGRFGPRSGIDPEYTSRPWPPSAH